MPGMNLLKADVAVDVANMPFEHLIAVLLFLLVLVAIAFMNGFAIKIGEKEINIGGIRKLLAKKDEDTLLQQSLKSFADEIDHQVLADIYDYVDEIGMRIEKVLMRKHCYFTVEKFFTIIKKELYKRIRRNNLRERLTEDNMDTYVDKVLNGMQEKYDFFQTKVKTAECDDEYGDFVMIKDAIRDELSQFYKSIKISMVNGMKKKITGYKKAIPQFKTVTARKFSCDDPIEKNKEYIRRLTGEEVQ